MSVGLQRAITPHGSPELYPLCLAGLWLTPNEGGLALSLPWADLLLGHQESLSRRTRCQAVCREDVSWTGGSPLSSFHPLLCQNSAVATDNACEIQL